MPSQLVEPGTILRVQSWDIRRGAPMKAEAAVGVLWPKSTGAFARGKAEVICIGPTEWLVISERAGDLELMKSLSGAFQGTPFRSTDVSAALVRLVLTGEQARDVLAKGCSLDLREEEFPVGRSARTRFASMPVVVRRLEPSVYECIVAASYRDYLLAWIEDAASEFATGSSRATADQGSR